MFTVSLLSVLALSRAVFAKPTSTTEIYTLSLHDALPIFVRLPGHHHEAGRRGCQRQRATASRMADRELLRGRAAPRRSEEHTSELQSLRHLVCRLLLEKKKKVR